jgi:hypothetical protein
MVGNVATFMVYGQCSNQLRTGSWGEMLRIYMCHHVSGIE